MDEVQTYGRLEEDFQYFKGIQELTRVREGDQKVTPSVYRLRMLQAVDLIEVISLIGKPVKPMVRNEGGVWEIFCPDKKGDIQVLGDATNGHQVQGDHSALWMEGAQYRI